MQTALLVTGAGLLQAEARRLEGIPRPFVRALGIALCVGGLARAMTTRGVVPGVSFALAILMAATALFALLRPLKARASRLLIAFVLVAAWAHAMGGLS
jgi:hypothetical protein